MVTTFEVKQIYSTVELQKYVTICFRSLYLLLSYNVAGKTVCGNSESSHFTVTVQFLMLH